MFFQTNQQSIGRINGIAPAAKATSTRTLLNQNEVIEALGVSRNWIHRHVKNGTFPKPIKISPRTLRWKREELERWLEERKS
jgi:prophage regulatory protein